MGKNKLNRAISEQNKESCRAISIKKEVKKQAKKELKKIFLFDILKQIGEGKNIQKIADFYQTSIQLIMYYIRKLEDRKYVYKVGYSVWDLTPEGKNLTKEGLDINEVRSHAFMWKIKIPHILKWIDRIKILERNNIPFKLVGTNKTTPSITINDKKIWLAKDHLTIYEPKSFFTKTSEDGYKYAVNSLLTTLRELEKLFWVSFKINGNYEFKVRRQHYALIRNILATQINEKGEKLEVRDKNGKLWLLVDNSLNSLKEFESVDKETGVEDCQGLQNYFNAQRETGFKVTATYVLDRFDQLTEICKRLVENQTTIQGYNVNEVNPLNDSYFQNSLLKKSGIKDNTEVPSYIG